MSIKLVLPEKRLHVLDAADNPVADVDRVEWLRVGPKGLKKAA